MKFIETLKTHWVVWVWNRSPNCAEMSRLASKSIEQRLPFNTRLAMWLHCLICLWCKRYSEQIAFIHKASPTLARQLDIVSPDTLSTESKERIKFNLKQSQQK